MDLSSIDSDAHMVDKSAATEETINNTGDDFAAVDRRLGICIKEDALSSAEMPGDKLTPGAEDVEPSTMDQQIENEISDVENCVLLDSPLEDMAEDRKLTRLRILLSTAKRQVEHENLGHRESDAPEVFSGLSDNY